MAETAHRASSTEAAYSEYSIAIRAVVFRLLKKMVILPPNSVGFRLTYTQL